MWPTYMVNLTHPWKCMDHIQHHYGGIKAPIRLGGTTQDAAFYDAVLGGYIESVPETLYGSIYGPKYLDLISKCLSILQRQYAKLTCGKHH